MMRLWICTILDFHPAWPAPRLVARDTRLDLAQLKAAESRHREHTSNKGLHLHLNQSRDGTKSQLEGHMETFTIRTMTNKERAANNTPHRIMYRTIYPTSMQSLPRDRELHLTSICGQDQPTKLACPKLLLSCLECLSRAQLDSRRCRERSRNRTCENPRRRYSRWLQICRPFLLVAFRLTMVKPQTRDCPPLLRL